MDIVCCEHVGQEPIVIEKNTVRPPYTVRQWRQALELAACRRYGQEGTDWRIVQDTTAIRFHVKALGDCAGQTIALE